MVVNGKKSKDQTRQKLVEADQKPDEFLDFENECHQSIEREKVNPKDRFLKQLDFAGVIFVELNRNGEVTFINSTGCELIGYHRTEIVGKNWFDFFIPDSIKHHVKSVFQKLINGEIAPVEYYENSIRTKAGAERIISWHNTILKDESGAIIGTMSSGTDITERRQMEDQLRASEEKYRLVSENIPVAVYSALPDEQSTNLFISGRMEELTGYSGKQFMDDPNLWEQIIHPEDRSLVWERILEHRQKKIVLDVEYRIFTKNQELKWIRDKATPFLNEQGEIVRIDGFMEDITKRKQSEEVQLILARLTETLNAMSRQKDAAVEILRAADQLFGWDACAVDIYSETEDKVIPIINYETIDGKRQEVHSRNDHTAMTPMMKKTWAEGPQLILRPDIRFTTEPSLVPFGDTTRKSASLMFVPIKKGERNIGWISIQSYKQHAYCQKDLELLHTLADHCSGAIERIKVQEELLASEEKYRLVVANANEGILIAQDGMLKLINPKIMMIMGYTEPEMLTKPFIEFIHPEDRQMVTDRHIRRLQGESIPNVYTFRGITKDGYIKWLELNAVLINWEGKAASLNFISDVTERKKAEQEIKNSISLLETTLEATVDGILVVDHQGKISKYNRKFQEMWHIPDAILETGSDDQALNFVLAQLKDPDQFLQKVKELYQQPLAESYDFLEFNDGRIFERFSRPQIVDSTTVGRVWSFRDVTERRKAEEALRRERDLISIIMETSPAGITMVDREGKIIFANPSAEQVLGLTRSLITQRTYNDPEWRITDYDGRPFPDEKLPFLLVKKTKSAVYDIRHAIEYPNGNRVLLSINAAPLFDAAGKFNGVVATVEDITRRITIEKELAIVHTTYREAIEKAQGVPYRLNYGKSCYEFIGDLCLDLLGVPFEELTFKRLRELIKQTILIDPHRQSDYKSYTEDFRKGKLSKYYADLKIVTPQGEEKWISDCAVPIWDHDHKKVIGSLGILMDITERKRSEQTLRESEENFRKIFENATDAMAILNPMGKIINVNRAAVEIYGDRRDKIIGKHFIDIGILEPKQFPFLIKQFKNMLSGNEVPLIVELMNKKGVRIFVESSASLIRKENKIFGVLVISRDITKRKQAEEEKVKLEEQLRQSQKMEAIGKLAGGIAHDFNNLLTAIIGNSELLLEDLESDNPMRIEVEEIFKASDRAAALTRQLLAFSRRQPLEMKIIDLNELVTNMEKMLRRMIGETIKLITEFEPKLRRIKADLGQIEEVIMNLTVNSHDAMPEGGKLTIATENVTIDEEYCKHNQEARPGKYVCLSLHDTGVGMDEAIVGRIFEPFFSTKGQGKGTGLGLSVVYGIIKQHQGWIDVFTRLEHGSTFKIYLPAFTQKAKYPPKQRTVMQNLRGKGERILLVEDETLVRNFTKKVLVENGYTVIDAQNAKEAEEIFEQEKRDFQLVFSDVVLPDKNSLLLVDELLTRKPDLKILLCSGYTDQKSQWYIIQERGFRFLQKPYAVADLLQTLQEILKNN